MIERTFIALAGGLIAAGVIPVVFWLLITSINYIGWPVVLASGCSVFIALWAVDWLSEMQAKRQK